MIPTGGYTYEGSAEIPAPAADVWALLIDLVKLNEWSRYTPSVAPPDGKTLGDPIVVGDLYTLQYRLTPDDKLQDCPIKITVYDKASMTIAWQGLPTFIAASAITAEKVQKVTPLPDKDGVARCLYEIYETEAGLMASMSKWTVGSKLNKMMAGTAFDGQKYFEGKSRTL